MNTVHTSKLLRRTTAVFAAVTGIILSGQSMAQSSVTLTGASGNSCTYSSMSVQPNGNVSVTCSGSSLPNPTPTPTPTGQSFAIASAPATLAPNEWGSIMVNRLGGSAGTATVTYTVSGGCRPVTGSIEFGDGYTGSAGFGIQAPAAGGGSCVATIASTNVGVVGSPGAATVSISGGVSQAGCPAVPNDVLDFDLKLSGADRLVMSSGRIASAILPGVKAAGGVSSSGQILLGESTLSPTAATVEISVNRCRGVIDTNAGFCYLNSSNPTFLKMEWIERTVWGGSTDSVAQAYGLCKAYLTNGPFYVNFRYTYSNGNCKYGQCGFVTQWNYAGY